jgi:phage tail P2-like protein
MATMGAPNRDTTNADRAPSHILPWLAWEMSVDVWNETWAEQVRREIIKASLQIHKRKGTIGALKTALQAFQFDDVVIEEWFDYGGKPYTFRVFINVVTSGFDLLKMDEVMAVIMSSKNARSHLESLQAYLTTKTNVPVVAIGGISGEITTIYPKQ